MVESEDFDVFVLFFSSFRSFRKRRWMHKQRCFFQPDFFFTIMSQSQEPNVQCGSINIPPDLIYIGPFPV